MITLTMTWLNKNMKAGWKKFGENFMKGAETLVLGETGVGLFPSIYFFGVG